MKALIRLAVGLVIPGIIIAFVPKSTVRPNKLSPEQLLTQIKSGSQYISPEEMADNIIKKDPSYQLIDVRSSKDYTKFNLPGSINIPLPQIISEKFSDVLDDETKTNVLYSNGNSEAIEAWMLLCQMGKQNVVVLQGGLNYWAETIMNPQTPKQNASNDEIAKYNFSKAANMALGGGNLEASDQSTNSAKPSPVKKGGGKKKKGASGGC